MARWWIGIALCTGWLGMASLASAQPFAASAAPTNGGPAYVAPPPTAEGAPENSNLPDGNGAAQFSPGAGMPFTPPFAPPGSLEGIGTSGGPKNAFVEKDKPNIPPEQLHISMDYLYWWFAKQPLPVLVTAGSFSDPVPAALGQPNTTVLIGGTFGSNQGSNGGQLTLAYDFDPLRTLGVDVRGFVFENQTNVTAVGGDGSLSSQAIGRPIFNANLNLNDADPVALPGVMSGTVEVREFTRFFGGETNLHYNLWDSCLTGTRGTLLIGGRYLDLEQSLLINDTRQDLPGLGVAGNSYFFQDNFTTHNRFYGGQLGMEAEWRLGPLLVTLVGKAAVGQNDMTVAVSGLTRVTEPGGVVTTASDRSVLVQPSNAGQHHLKDLGFVPAGEFYVGCDVNDNIRLSLGYSCLYWLSILRPGNQIDPTINIQALQVFDQVGPARPGVTFSRSDFWAQGLTASLMLSF